MTLPLGRAFHGQHYNMDTLDRKWTFVRIATIGSARYFGLNSSLCADWAPRDGSQWQHCRLDRPDVAVPVATVLWPQKHFLKILVRCGNRPNPFRQFIEKPCFLVD